jgi:hypothetical protein
MLSIRLWLWTLFSRIVGTIMLETILFESISWLWLAHSILTTFRCLRFSQNLHPIFLLLFNRSNLWARFGVPTCWLVPFILNGGTTLHPSSRNCFHLIIKLVAELITQLLLWDIILLIIKRKQILININASICIYLIILIFLKTLKLLHWLSKWRTHLSTFWFYLRNFWS